jgi:hypothetical protein
LKKTPTTKLQLSLQPQTMTSKIEKNTSYQAPTELTASNQDFWKLKKTPATKLQLSLQPPTMTLKLEEIIWYKASNELAATNQVCNNWKKNKLPSFNWACSHEPRLRKLEKKPATKLQLSLQPRTKTLESEKIISNQASTELAATNQVCNNWKKNKLPSFNWACSHEPRRWKLEKYTANKLQPSLQPPTKSVIIEKEISKQASTELAATNQVCNNWKKNMLPSFNWACSHEPRRWKLEKYTANKLQPSLQPPTKFVIIEKKICYQASTEPAATNHDFENWRKHQLPSFSWACNHEPWLRKMIKTPVTKLQLSLQPPTKILKIEKNTSYQAPTELIASNQDFEKWKNNQIPSFKRACSQQPSL